jgi:hypothetical protein
MTTNEFLILAAFACIGIPALALHRGTSAGWLGVIVVFGAPLAAACYLLTLATGWAP